MRYGGPELHGVNLLEQHWGEEGHHQGDPEVLDRGEEEPDKCVHTLLTPVEAAREDVHGTGG